MAIESPHPPDLLHHVGPPGGDGVSANQHRTNRGDHTIEHEDGHRVAQQVVVALLGQPGLGQVVPDPPGQPVWVPAALLGQPGPEPGISGPSGTASQAKRECPPRTRRDDRVLGADETGPDRVEVEPSPERARSPVAV